MFILWKLGPKRVPQVTFLGQVLIEKWSWMFVLGTRSTISHTPKMAKTTQSTLSNVSSRPLAIILSNIFRPQDGSRLLWNLCTELCSIGMSHWLGWVQKRCYYERLWGPLHCSLLLSLLQRWLVFSQRRRWRWMPRASRKWIKLKGIDERYQRRREYEPNYEYRWEHRWTHRWRFWNGSDAQRLKQRRMIKEYYTEGHYAYLRYQWSVIRRHDPKKRQWQRQMQRQKNHLIILRLLKVRPRSVPFLLLRRVPSQRDLQSSPPHSLVLSPFLARNGPSAPAWFGQLYCAMCQKQSAINCENLIFVSDTFISGWKCWFNQNWGPRLFESFFWESPQNPASSFLPPPSQKRQAFSP